MEFLAVISGLFFLVVVFGAPFRWHANKKKFQTLTKELDYLKSRTRDLEDKIGIRDEMTPSESVASVVPETLAEAAPAPGAPPLEPSPPLSPPPSQAVPSSSAAGADAQSNLGVKYDNGWGVTVSIGPLLGLKRT